MKKLLLIAAFLLSGILCFAQEKPFNTVLTIGHTFHNDISFSVGGRFNKVKNLTVTYDHGYNFDTRLPYNYIGIGAGSEKSIVLFKFGAKTEPYEFTHINYTDYGIEYLWIDKTMGRNFCYGLTMTRRNGVGVKIGIVF